MRTMMDSAGRVVLPKSVRDALHLEAGMTLDVRVLGGRVELTPAPTPMRLERQGTGRVATTDDPLPPLDAHEVRAVVERQRR